MKSGRATRNVVPHVLLDPFDLFCVPASLNELHDDESRKTHLLSGPVYLIVKMLASGDTIEELIEDYPSITKEDILACLAYAGALAEDENIPSDVVIESAK